MGRRQLCLHTDVAHWQMARRLFFPLPLFPLALEGTGNRNVSCLRVIKRRACAHQKQAQRQLLEPARSRESGSRSHCPAREADKVVRASTASVLGKGSERTLTEARAILTGIDTTKYPSLGCKMLHVLSFETLRPGPACTS
jgi:hypothetical protein